MNIMEQYTHPFVDSQVLDQSQGTEVVTPDNTLHEPMFPIRAPKGRGEPYRCNGTQAIAEYGEQAFDQYEKYYRNEQYYLMNAIYPNQTAWIFRMIPDDAVKASTVIEAHITKDVSITQYRRDENGGYIYDEDGNKLPELDAGNNPIVEPGVRIKYTRRVMTQEEIANNIVETRSVEVGGVVQTSYPICHGVFDDAGSAGNLSGFQLYVNYQDQKSDLVDATGALLWTFAPMEQPYDSNVANSVRDVYNGVANQMTMKPNTLDPFTVRRMYADDVINRLYYDTKKQESLLPYTMKFYPEHIKMIGDVIAEYETNNTDLIDGWYVDILSLLDKDGHQYHHAELDISGDDAVQMTNLYTHFFEGGDDGDISDEAFEAQWRQVLLLNKYPELIETRRYPITHIYDVGYPLETKFAMADFMAVQKRCKIELAAQDMHRHLYSMDEAVSLAAAIRARCAITPESEFYGTPAMRVSIFAQSGYVNDTSITSIVPATYWMAQKRAEYHNGMTMNRTWTDYPANVVNIFRKDNFTPYSVGQREILWDGAANYYQYATRTSKFFASIRTIYKTQSSMLTDQEYTDACVYLMYIVDRVWVYHVGKNGYAFAKYKDIVEKDIVKYAYQAFGDRYPVSANVYVTQDDVSRKDSMHIDTILLGYRPFRRWFNTIIVRGEELTPTESTEI